MHTCTHTNTYIHLQHIIHTYIHTSHHTSHHTRNIHIADVVYFSIKVGPGEEYDYSQLRSSLFKDYVKPPTPPTPPTPESDEPATTETGEVPVEAPAAEAPAVSETDSDGRPALLWWHTTVQMIRTKRDGDSMPTNMFRCPDPDFDVDVDVPLSAATEIFRTLVPGERFLPKSQAAEEQEMMEDLELDFVSTVAVQEEGLGDGDGHEGDDHDGDGSGPAQDSTEAAGQAQAETAQATPAATDDDTPKEDSVNTGNTEGVQASDLTEHTPAGE
eukprot:GFYU01004739.1.p2 GENE.GFYU01004739.1~~GFYU01004739.1.p2  ORF type:complete len:272 (-),score=46.11 GFYU01004739.1:83-898(-)